jgi:hypothetical protein
MDEPTEEPVTPMAGREGDASEDKGEPLLAAESEERVEEELPDAELETGAREGLDAAAEEAETEDWETNVPNMEKWMVLY